MASTDLDYTNDTESRNVSEHRREVGRRRDKRMRAGRAVGTSSWKFTFIGYALSVMLLGTNSKASSLRKVEDVNRVSEAVIWTDIEYLYDTSQLHYANNTSPSGYDTTMIRAIYAAHMWYNEVQDSAILLEGVILINCSSNLLWQVVFTMAKHCFCYHEDGVMTDGENIVITAVSCNTDAATYLLYSDITYGIVKQSKWTNVVIVSDYPLQIPQIWSTNEYMGKRTVITCGTAMEELIPLIEHAFILNDDFWNVLFHCNETLTISHLTQLFTADSAIHRLRFNLLLIGLTPEHFRLVQPMLRDGDNVVLMNMASKNTTVQHVIKHGKLQLTYPLGLISLHWCYTDCFLGQPIKHLGLFSTRFDLDHLGFDLLPGTFSSFYGRRLTIACVEYRPFCETVQLADGSSTHVGLEIEIIQALADAYNFTFQLKEPADQKFGSKNADGTWNGMVGMLVRKEAAIAISGVTVTADREQAVDFLYPHWEEPSAIIVRLSSNKWLYFVETFSLPVWCMVFAMPGITATILIFITMVSQSMEGVEMKEKSIVKRYLHHSYNCYFKAYGALMLQGTNLPARYRSSRFVIAFFWFAIIMMTAVFSGNLTATLAVNKVKMPFRTLEELANDRDYILQITRGTFREILFKESKTGVYRKLWEKILADPEESLATSRQTAYEKVLQGGYAYTADKTALWEWIKQGGDCDLVFLPEFYFRSGLGIMVPEGSPYKRTFDKIIVNLLETGLIEVWYKNYSSQDVCTIASYTTISQPVRLLDLTYVLLYMLCLGLGISVLTLVSECLIKAAQGRRTEPKCCDQLRQMEDIRQAECQLNVRGYKYSQYGCPQIRQIQTLNAEELSR